MLVIIMLQWRKKKTVFWHDFAYVLELGLQSFFFWSAMRPSGWCSVAFWIFWPSGDSLSDKSESWCFWCVLISIDFVFTILVNMWLALCHIQMWSRQSCCVFWTWMMLFKLLPFTCHFQGRNVTTCRQNCILWNLWWVYTHFTFALS